MNLGERFSLNWNKHFSHIHPNGSHLLLALSGGLDSTVLTDIVAKSGFGFSIAHCNFQLRGEESERDEQFVTQLAETYQVSLYIKKFDTGKIAADKKQSIQITARELRYNWFKQLLNSELPAKHSGEKAYWLVTAHHADDNIETVLMNIFRGTGISGLHGILHVQGKVIRPLLFARRSELEDHANSNQLSWVEDSSNASDKYSRNFFRQNIIPQVQQVYPKATENLLHNIERWQQAELIYNDAIDKARIGLCEIRNNEVHIPCLKLLKQPSPSTLLFEICRQYGFTSAQLSDMTHLLHAETGKYVASPTHRIIRNRNWLIISPIKTIEADLILIEKSDKIIYFSNGALYFSSEKADKINIANNSNIALLDSREIQLPLILRKWKQGDYFYPLGMQKKKKLSKFLSGQKLSLTEKENTWVLEMNRKILWVIGHRIDDRFKLTDSTTNVLKVELRMH